MTRLPDFEVMACAQRIDLRLRLALCGALHMDKIFQSASACRLASWNFVAKIKNFRPCEGAKVMFRGTTLL
jgi:hypothetical protein